MLVYNTRQVRSRERIELATNRLQLWRKDEIKKQRTSFTAFYSDMPTDVSLLMSSCMLTGLATLPLIL